MTNRTFCNDRSIASITGANIELCLFDGFAASPSFLLACPCGRLQWLPLAWPPPSPPAPLSVVRGGSGVQFVSSLDCLRLDPQFDQFGLLSGQFRWHLSLLEPPPHWHCHNDSANCHYVYFNLRFYDAENQSPPIRHLFFCNLLCCVYLSICALFLYRSFEQGEF